jgi:hypothetical protein
MNERIENLAQGCFEYFEGTLDGDIVEFDYKKFAELIVRECAEVAQMNTPDTEECEYTHLISEKIREHFGVEE